MKVCSECSFTTQDDQKVCPNCGSVLPPAEVPEIEEVSIVDATVAAAKPSAEQLVTPVEDSGSSMSPPPVPTVVYQPQPQAPYQAPLMQSQAYYPPAAAPAARKIELPVQYRPLGAWAYFGYTMLFSVPIVGFIFLIVFSFNNGNINRRNYARSYWCALLIAAIIIAVYVLIWVITAVVLGVSVGNYIT